MSKKCEFTILGRAMQTVPGFEKVYHKLNQQTILSGRSQSTFDNYIRCIALVCLEYNRLPEDISEDEINEYLFPVRMLSTVFRGKMPEKIKGQLRKSNQLLQYQSLLDGLWKKPLVLYCEPVENICLIEQTGRNGIVLPNIRQMG